MIIASKRHTVYNYFMGKEKSKGRLKKQLSAITAYYTRHYETL